MNIIMTKITQLDLYNSICKLHFKIILIFVIVLAINLWAEFTSNLIWKDSPSTYYVSIK
jgi:hypothetical protein